EILRLDQVGAAELLFGLCERPVSHHSLAVAHADCRGRRGLLERRAALILPALRQVLGEGLILLEDLAVLGRAHLLSIRLAAVDQKYVVHCVSPCCPIWAYTISRTATRRIDT